MNITNWGATQKDISFNLDKDFIYNKKHRGRGDSRAVQIQNLPYQRSKPAVRNPPATRFVTRNSLPTELALASSVSSPYVQRSNFTFNPSFNSRYNTNSTSETPRDIIKKYSFSAGKSDVDRSALDFSGIFNVDFTSNDAPRKPLLPLITEGSSKAQDSRVRDKSTKSSSTDKRCNNGTTTIPQSANSSKHFVTPSTSHVTARTPKTTTTGSSSATNHTIIAVTEGRGHSRGEVGIAAIDLKRPYLILCQISDTQTYMNTLRKINILNPVQILVPNSFCDKANNKLYQLLLDHFPRLSFVNIQRKFFNETQGLQQIQSLCLPEYSSIQLIVMRKTFALAATAAIIRYAEFEQSMMFAPKSVKIDYQSGDNITFIDLETTQKLELVMSQSIGNPTTEKTLFATLNNCCTVGGQRRLRSLILQPSTEGDAINERLDCVTEMIESPELFYSVKAVLPKFVDAEQLLCLCTQIPNVKDNMKGAEMQINYSLLLKTSLEVIPRLSDALKNAKTKFFRDFVEVLENPHYKQMIDKISEVLNDDSHLSKSFVMSQFQRCFAIKTGVNGFLDIARLTYSELLGDFNEVVENLIKEYHLPLTIRTLRSKGSVLQMKLTNENRNFNLKDLPPIFIQVQKTRTLITMTTKELLFLKERMNHFIHEIELLSSAIIFNLLQDIRPYVGSLYKLCEYIADLDVIVSFAQISKNFMFVRPSFSEKCTNSKASLHPILNHISSSKPIANDIFSSIDQNLSIITGPNMGGKSVYIRQIALLQIMAQIGCYVPAESAQFRITDRIFARIGFNDSIECNASSFILEIKEMQYIINSLTPRSLIIIDELCRGTSTEEGTCIAWAICEKLLASKAFIFFTTHFLYLTKLQDVYCSVINYHFEANEVNSEEGKLSTLIYTHRLVPGVLKLDHYGLKLARSTAMPDKVLELSEKTAKKLSAEWKVTSVAENNLSENKQIDNVILTLLDMINNDNVTIDGVKNICEYAISLNLRTFENPPSTAMQNESIFEDQVVKHTPNPIRNPSLEDLINDEENLSFVMTPAPSEHSDNLNPPVSFPQDRYNNNEESMEFIEHSDDENLQQISQFSTSSVENEEEMCMDEDHFSPQRSPAVSDSICSSVENSGNHQPGSSQISKNSSENMTMGFVMSKKTFDFKPIFDDSKFWRMNETTFTVQGIMKGAKNKTGVKKKVQF